MGTCLGVEEKPNLKRSNSQQNVHVVQPDIKVHTVVSGDMDFDHAAAMKIPLGEVSDEQLRKTLHKLVDELRSPIKKK